MKIKSDKQAKTITITLPESEAELVALTMMKKAWDLSAKHKGLGQNMKADVWDEVYMEYFDLLQSVRI